jgi:hypothetical protein
MLREPGIIIENQVMHTAQLDYCLFVEREVKCVVVSELEWLRGHDPDPMLLMDERKPLT